MYCMRQEQVSSSTVVTLSIAMIKIFVSFFAYDQNINFYINRNLRHGARSPGSYVIRDV